MEKIRYNLYGAENKQTIIFIHGAFVSSRMWEKEVHYFKDYYKVITYDLRGHGVNRESKADLNFELYSKDLKHLIERVDGGEKPIICGLSLGGMIAQYFAVRYPEHYKALILCDTSVSISLTCWDNIMHLLFPKWLMVNLLKLYTIKSYVKQSIFIAKLSRGTQWLGKRETIAYEKEEMLEMKKSDWVKVFGTIYSFRKQQLANIRKPTLIILGEFEPRSIYKHAEVLKKEIPNARIEVINDAGHIPNLDQPRRFHEVTHAFTKDLLQI